MRLQPACLCGPQRRPIRDAVSISDRNKRADPSGTAPLQRKFADQMDARWRQLKSLATEAVAKRFAGASAETVAHAVATGDDPLRAFQAWIDEALRQTVLGTLPMSWTAPFVARAAMMARARAAQLVPTRDAGPEDEERDDHGRWTEGSGAGSLPQTSTPEFKRWFGASKIVDDHNRPLVVYHGSNQDLGEGFRTNKIGTRANWDQGYLGSGFYFGSADTASVYARGGAQGRDPTGGNVTPVFLSLQNPLRVDAQFLPKNERRIIPVEIDRAITVRKALGLGEKATAKEVATQAQAKGHDGLIYNYRGDNEYVVFDPSKIKSAIGNKGTFDPKSNKLRDAAPFSRLRTLQTMCVAELQGICEAVSQQAVRALAEGTMTRQSPPATARAIAGVIDSVGRARGRQLASFIMMRAFSAATLDHFRAAGLRSVGTVAERTRRIGSTSGLVRDAKRKNFNKPKLIEVLTAGDDDVCPECQDISDEGPYSLDDAEGLIPAHPNCRCAFVPADDDRFASVHDYDPDEERDDAGRWSFAGGSALRSWTPPQSNEGWKSVAGQDHDIDEPPLPKLRQATTYTDKTGQQHAVPGERMSSGVIMRERDGRTWVIKPTNGYGGYNYTFPKGGVEDGLHPQANAIKEAYEETGLKARITGFAGDYRGDTGTTRMYHAVREDGHPKDKGWETEKVRLAKPSELPLLLNRSRDKKIAAHHVPGAVFDAYDPDEPRDEHGEWTSGGGAAGFANTLKEGGIPHTIEHHPESNTTSVKVENQHDLPSLQAAAESHGSFKHKAAGINNAYYQFEAHPEREDDESKFEAAHDLNAPLDMSKLVKVSGKMGSNEGGVYEGVDASDPYNKTKQYYIKQPATTDHVANELLTAKLYQLAGTRTLNYVPVAGGAHVATEVEDLAKSNVSQLNSKERIDAQRDFAVHAWLANWDAAGTGGDNVGVRKNDEVVTLDTGGGLKYRAQGEPKGAAFGYGVLEINTLRDPSKNPDAAGLYGDMTDEQMVESMKRVTSLHDGDVVKTVLQNGGDMHLANQLIARKDDILVRQQELQAKIGHEKTTSMGAPTTTQAAIAPEPTAFKTKMEHAKHLLLKGVTAEDMKAKLGWKAMNIPGTADKLGLVLTKTKIGGGKFHYKGVPKTAVAAATPTMKLGGAFHEPGTKSIESPLEAKTLHAMLVNNGVTTAQHFPAELKDKNYQDTHSYAVTIPGEYGKMKDLIGAAGYKMDPYEAKDGGLTYYGVRVPAGYDATKSAAPFVTVAGHDISTPLGNFKQSLEEHGVEYLQGTGSDSHDYVHVKSNAAKAEEIAKWHPAVTTLSPGSGTFSIAKNPDTKFVEPKATTVTPPTDAELQKAKKNVALQMQYVPGAQGLENHPQANQLLAAFNKKYEGKTLDEDELPGKVADFKQLTMNMVPLMSAQQQEQLKLQSASAAEKATAQAKAVAAQKAKQAAEKDAFEASLSDPKVKAQYDALHSIGSTSGPHLEKGYSQYIKKLATQGHNITGADAAYIVAYRGSHYDNLNESLWKGDKMNLKQSIYASALEKALNKMPSYAGTAERGVKTSGAFARYAENVGHVVTEKGFSSYGATHKLWGNEATIHLKASDLKDIRTFNPGEGGGELILQRGAMIHITKVNPKTREVWAEQVG